MKVNKLIIILTGLLFIVACNNKIGSENNKLKPELPTPKNVILLIGDGMGLTQITAGLYTNNNSLFLEEFKNVGLHKSYSADKLITDSAAGATAFACGVKTYNGAIGVDQDTNAVRTLLEMAESKNMPTGLIATSTITHATPGSFIAHQPSRKMQEAIAADFLKTEVDIFIGGGMKFFNSRDTDDRNISDELRSNNYVIESYFEKVITEINF